MLWLAIAAVIAALGYGIWRVRRRWAERQRAADERLAGFIAQARPPAPVPVAMPATAPQAPGLAQQKLLVEAAAKAAEAGEPALSIQLCARLIARYPDSALAGEARASIEAQKKKLAKAQSSG